MIAQNVRSIGLLEATLSHDWVSLAKGVGPAVLPVRPYAQLVDCGDIPILLAVLPTRPLGAWARGQRIPMGSEACLCVEQPNRTVLKVTKYIPVRFKSSDGVWVSMPGADDIPDAAGGAGRLDVLRGVALARRYSWLVRIRKPGGVWAELFTDPSSTKAAFKLRDIPDGKRRREALMNWVSAHKRLEGTEDETEVRKHLRGASTFTAGGLECRVCIPEFDAEKLARMRTQEGQHG